jgi:hypothetical protein
MPKNIPQCVVLLVLLAIHLIADFVLCSHSTSDQTITIIGFSLPMSQAGLFALWACAARWKSYVRFPLAMLGITWTWYVAIRFIPIARDGELAASYALFFVVHAVAIVAIYYVSRFALRWIARRRNADAAELPPLQFSIGFLLIWTAVFALFLGLGKMLCLEMGWLNQDVIHGTYFFFGCVIGTYNGIYALFAFAAAMVRRRLFLHIVIAAVAIGLIALSEEFLLKFVFGNNGGVHWYEWLLMAGGQAVFLFATLLPLRWCGLLGGTCSVGTEGNPAVPVQDSAPSS